MSSSSPATDGPSTHAALFEHESQAHQAVAALHEHGVSEQHVRLFQPGATDADVSQVLQSMGMPDGETRFYVDELQAGRTLVVVDPASGLADGREVLLNNGGYDVQSRGGELARPAGAGVPGGTGARPIDITGEWDDVASRYEMLWQQHYGTTDQTWERMAPVYRYAWQLANDARYRGRPWSEAEAAVQSDWETAQSPASWADVAGPIRDVWEDVAEEAAMGAEGGQDRRIPRQGGDQAVAARQVRQPG